VVNLNIWLIDQQTDAVEILRQRELGFSFVRLLPKETGVRPIVNLRRKLELTQRIEFQSLDKSGPPSSF
jgi:hypothetical protein